MGTNLQPPPPNTNIRLGGATWQQKGFKEHKRTEEAKACEQKMIYTTFGKNVVAKFLI
jgi:hypothetical protein